MTLKEHQEQIKKEFIIDEAYRHLIKYGYEKMNMDVLAKELGISKATLYKQLKSKEELVLNVLLKFMKQGEKELKELQEIDSSLPIIQTLNKIIRRGFKDRFILSTAIAKSIPSFIRENPEYIKHLNKLLEQITKIIDLAKEQGDIKEELPTPIIVSLILCVFRLDANDIAIDNKYTLDEVINSLLDIFSYGLLTKNKNKK